MDRRAEVIALLRRFAAYEYAQADLAEAQHDPDGELAALEAGWDAETAMRLVEEGSW